MGKTQYLLFFWLLFHESLFAAVIVVSVISACAGGLLQLFGESLQESVAGITH